MAEKDASKAFQFWFKSKIAYQQKLTTTIFIMRILDAFYLRNLVYGKLKGSCLK